MGMRYCACWLSCLNWRVHSLTALIYICDKLCLMHNAVACSQFAGTGSSAWGLEYVGIQKPVHALMCTELPELGFSSVWDTVKEGKVCPSLYPICKGRLNLWIQYTFWESGFTTLTEEFWALPLELALAYHCGDRKKNCGLLYAATVKSQQQTH
jgi:hypothetical protein